jgi:nitroreductase
MSQLRTELPVHPLIAGRFSPRAFTDEDIRDEDLDLVLEAARLAPSSMNEQPWRFLVTRRGGEGHAALLDSLMESNRIWAFKAPVLILTLSVQNLARNGQPNHYAWHDTGLAIGQLTIQAGALGLGIHQLGGFHADQAREAFGIPADHDLVSVLALGYPGDPDSLPDNLRSRELQRSVRRPVSEIVWRGKVGG